MSKKLTSRLTILVASLLFLFVFLFGLAFSVIFWQHAQRVEQARIETKLLNMSDYIGKHYKGKDLVKTYGHKFFQLSNTLDDEIWIVDKNTLHLAGSKNYPELAYDQLPVGCAKDIQQIFAGKHITSTNFSVFTNNSTSTVGIPIYNQDKEVIGALLVHYQLPNFFDSWYDSLGIIILTTIIIYLLLLWLSYIFIKRYTMPLSVFNLYIQKLLNKNYSSKLKLPKSEDYRLLANDLNSLAKYLAHEDEILIEEKLHTKTLLLNSAYANYEVTTKLENLLHDMHPYLARYLPKALRNRLFNLKEQLTLTTADLFREQAPDLLGFKLAPLNLLDIINTTLDKFKFNFATKQIQVTQQAIPQEGILPLQADANRIEQMLSIIFKLILIYLPANSQVSINYEQDPSRYIITIDSKDFKQYNQFLNNNLHYLVARNLAHLQKIELRYEAQNINPCYRLIITKNFSL